MFDGIEKATRGILEGDPAPGLDRYNEWKSTRAANIVSGARKSAIITAATGEHAGSDMDEIPVEIVKVRTGMGIRSSRLLGRLVHTILHDIDLAGAQQFEVIARVHGRRLRASDDEVAASIKAVVQVLRHTGITSNTDAELFREFPFVLRRSNGHLIEGKIDFAIRGNSGWSVIDFKVGPADSVQYNRQVQMYAAALRMSADLPVRAYLLEST